MSANEYVVDGEPKQRPDLEIDDQIKSGSIGDVDIGFLPLGTEVYRDSIILAGKSAGGRLNFTAPKPGRFRFRLVPPFPYREKMVTVVVDEATVEADRREREEQSRLRAASGLSGLVVTPIRARSNP